MTVTAVTLIVLAALVHAAWNLYSKRQHPSAAYFFAATLAGSIFLAPLPFALGCRFVDFPARVWVLVVCSGFFLAAYYVCLAGAYRCGDMSVAYPLARSAPVIVVTFVTLVLGRGDQVSATCIAGIFLVVGGCFILPRKRFADLRSLGALNLSCLLALGAAFGSAGYSVSDDEALRCLRSAGAVQLGPVESALTYVFFEAFAACLWLLAFLLLRHRSRAQMRHVVNTQWPAAMATGVAIFAAYLLVLVSLAFVKNVSYVVAFRQLSVPLGAVLGVVLLHEPGYPAKFIGIAIMFLGLVLVSLG